MTPRVYLVHQEGASAPDAEARFSMVEGAVQPSLSIASGGRAATDFPQQVFHHRSLDVDTSEAPLMQPMIPPQPAE